MDEELGVLKWWERETKWCSSLSVQESLPDLYRAISEQRQSLDSTTAMMARLATVALMTADSLSRGELIITAA